MNGQRDEAEAINAVPASAGLTTSHSSQALQAWAKKIFDQPGTLVVCKAPSDFPL